MNDVANTRAAEVGGEIDAIDADIKSFVENMTSRSDKLETESQRIEFETAMAGMMREFTPLMTEETRKHFGPRLQFDQGDVGPDDGDPARQRRAAVDDGRDPSRTVPLNAAQELTDDPRGVAVNAALSKADQAVKSRFEQMNMNGNLALSRIINGSDVDRQTRRNWMDRDVKAYANANSMSEKQARKDVEAAYRDAAAIYRNARSEIRGINRDFAEGRGVEVAAAPQQTARSPVRETQQTRTPSQPAPSDNPERKDPQRLDLKAGVRGEIVATGEAQFDPEDEDSMSPYVDMKIDGHDKPKRLWGVGLPDMMERHGLKVGDIATIAQNGKEEVTVKKRNKDTGVIEEKNVLRNKWDAREFDYKKDRDAIDRKYDKIVNDLKADGADDRYISENKKALRDQARREVGQDHTDARNRGRGIKR